MKNKKILTDVLLKNEQAEDTWEYKHLKIMPNSRSSHERISVLKKKKWRNIIENEANTDGRVTH